MSSKFAIAQDQRIFVIFLLILIIVLIKLTFYFFLPNTSKSLESRVKLIKSIGAGLLLLQCNVVIDITMLYYSLNLFNESISSGVSMTGSKNNLLTSRVSYYSSLKTHIAQEHEFLLFIKFKLHSFLG